jgi:hypothetical protein
MIYKYNPSRLYHRQQAYQSFCLEPHSIANSSTYLLTYTTQRLKMRFTAVFISVLAWVTFVAAQENAEPTCTEQNGGPSTAEKDAVLAAFQSRYLPDGVYRPQGTYALRVFLLSWHYAFTDTIL